MRYLFFSIFGLIINIGFYTVTVAQTTQLLVPYTSQSPSKLWVQPWQDACEEASISMVDAYYRGESINIISSTAAQQSIKNIIALENKTFQHNKDTNAAETALIINLFFRWEAQEKINPTLDEIKYELDSGRPVIAPVYGKGLKNSLFRNGGPDYHMLVITGYNDATQMFITNEPGINHGLDFQYSYDTLMDAIHDYVPDKKTSTGAKIVLFTSPTIAVSSETDGDRDGANKKNEIDFVSSLQNADTDHDGFSDGTEIHNGYSPTTNERKLKNGDLVKTKDNSSVFYYRPGTKQPILSEEVFIKKGWKFTSVKLVGQMFMDSLTLGKMIDT